jgi:hypothetical protein
MKRKGFLATALALLGLGPVGREINDASRVRGRVTARVFGPDGELKQEVVTHNLITANGDQYCAKKQYSTPTAMSGMKLGTASTAAAKTGAGSFQAVADYVSGSAHALDATYPKQGATADIAQYKCTWAAGEATATGIQRVSITDNTTNAGEADGTHTLAIAVLSPSVNKGASDTLVVTWDHTFLGA